MAPRPLPVFPVLPLHNQAEAPEHFRGKHSISRVLSPRRNDTSQIPKAIAPRRVDSKADGLQITCALPPLNYTALLTCFEGNTSDNHVSFYPWAWLRENSYDPPLRRPTTEKIFWGPSEVKSSPPTIPYQEVMKGDRGLFNWLSNVVSPGPVVARHGS
jgi:trimethyllysine dioxygenase